MQCWNDQVSRTKFEQLSRTTEKTKKILQEVVNPAGRLRIATDNFAQIDVDASFRNKEPQSLAFVPVIVRFHLHHL